MTRYPFDWPPDDSCLSAGPGIWKVEAKRKARCTEFRLRYLTQSHLDIDLLPYLRVNNRQTG
jgi:hypothetical protein